MGWWKDKLGIDTSSLIGVTSGLIPYSSSKQREAAKDAQADRLKGLKAAERLQQEGIDQARADINRLFPQAIEAARGGYQGALDVFGQSLPAQAQAFQQGNLGAQQQILAGLPLAQSAILGGQIDYSALQPYQAQMPDLSFFQQTLPAIQAQRDEEARLAQHRAQAQAGAQLAKEQAPAEHQRWLNFANQAQQAEEARLAQHRAQAQAGAQLAREQAPAEHQRWLNSANMLGGAAQPQQPQLGDISGGVVSRVLAGPQQPQLGDISGGFMSKLLAGLR